MSFLYFLYCCCSVTKLCLTPHDPMGCSTPGFPALTNSWSLPKFISIKLMMPPNHLILFCPYLLPPSFFPSIRVFPVNQLFTSVAKLLDHQLWHQCFQWVFRVDFLWDWLVRSPCSPRDSPESSPAPQFKCINSSALWLLYGTALTSANDCSKDNSLDYTDLCWQSDVFAF